MTPSSYDVIDFFKDCPSYGYTLTLVSKSNIKSKCNRNQSKSNILNTQKNYTLQKLHHSDILQSDVMFFCFFWPKLDYTFLKPH